jgi:arylsulfatase A-like enzyme
MHVLRCAALAAVAVLLAAGVSCGSRSASRPNVLLISVDSLRADRTDGVSSPYPTGPRVRALATAGTVFTQAVSTAPWTTPSMMTVLTGLFPWSHHVRDHNFSLAPGTLLLAERLHTLGYATAAIVPDTTLRAEFGFSRGFDVYDNGGYGHDTLSSSSMSGKALSWIQAHAGKPWFCWIHLWDPHYNYIPPAPFDRTFPSTFRPPPGVRYDLAQLKFHEAPLRTEECAFLMAQYEGEILYTDQFIGEILEYIASSGQESNTLVVLLGDHGESFQEHRWLTHTNQVYDEMVRVPLVFKWPGRVSASRRIDEPVSLVSVAPTILDLIGASPGKEEMEGVSLGPALTAAVTTKPPEDRSSPRRSVNRR